MKTSFLEKSTWKWIFAWLSVCWVFFLGAFASNLTSLDNFLINQSPHLLTLNKWNWLIWSLSGSVSTMDALMDKYKVPAWAVMIFDWGGDCPDWWTRWVWAWERFIMPLQSWTSPVSDWTKTFTIGAQNLPKHSHYILSAGEWNASVNAAKSLSERNFWGTNNWDFDYILKWSSSEPTYLKTSDVWSDHPEPITFMPEYQKVLFCKKLP